MQYMGIFLGGGGGGGGGGLIQTGLYSHAGEVLDE